MIKCNVKWQNKSGQALGFCMSRNLRRTADRPSFPAACLFTRTSASSGYSFTSGENVKAPFLPDTPRPPIITQSTSTGFNRPNICIC